MDRVVPHCAESYCMYHSNSKQCIPTKEAAVLKELKYIVLHLGPPPSPYLVLTLTAVSLSVPPNSTA